MGVYSISDSALAGLQIAQAGILVTSQNVAGTSVEGYSRRNANATINQLAPNSLMLNGTSFAVEGFTRQYSSLIGSQLLSQQAKSTYSDTLVQYTAALDNVISTKSVGLTTAITEFFNAMGTYATDPSNKALAAGITGKANVVAQRMNGLSDIVGQIKSQAQTGLEDTVSQVNTLIPELASINLQIEKANNPGNTYPSADLLDERDRILSDIQKLVGGQSLINSNGTATHMVGGLALIERGVANKVSLNADQEHIALQFNTQNGKSKTVLQTVQSLDGGQAGALLKLANEFAPSIQKRLDTIALSLVKVANSASGTDGDGAPKTAIFGFQVGENQYYDLNSDYSSLIPDITSETDMTDLFSSLSNAVSTVSDLQTGDSLIMNSESAVVTFSALSSGQTVTLGGLTFTASATTTAAQVASAFANGGTGRGDGDTISSTVTDSDSNTIGTIAGTVSDWNIDSYSLTNGTAKFTSTITGNVANLANTGSGTATVATTASSADIEVASIIAKSSVTAGEYTLTMMDSDQLQMEDSTGKTQTINLEDISAGASRSLDFYQFGITIDLDNLSVDASYTADELVASLDGKSVTISGSANGLYYYGLNADNFVSIAPSDPDDYYDGSAPNISSDSANTVQKMSSIFGISVSSLVNDVGIQVATWTNTQKADDAVLSSLKDQRDAVSGVNLDEEAANLLKYQQLYSASTKVLQTGNQMFNTLLAIMN
jgi:flagellar hook-associated protein FlgK